MKKRASGYLVAIIGLLGGLALSANSFAELVSYEFTGTVQIIEPLTGPPLSDDALAALSAQSIDVGAQVTGFYTLDTDTPGGGTFFNAAPEVRFQIGDLIAEIPAPVFGSDRVTVSAPFGGPHFFDLLANIVPIGNEFSTVSYDLFLYDGSGTALSGNGIPNPIPDLDAFDSYDGTLSSSQFGAIIDTGFGLAKVVASVDTHVRVVPLPGAAVLLLSGLFGLTAVARSRK